MHNFVNQLLNVDRFRRGIMGVQDMRQEPTFLTFSIDIPFKNPDNQFDQLTGMHMNPLFNFKKDDPFSAYNYLAARNFVPEAARLSKFAEILEHLIVTEPWFFQSIKGLDTMWKQATDFKDPNKSKDLVLEFETLESLDLRITYLADLYRKAAFDTVYMREILPDNLRYFTMYVYAAEFRNITTLTEQVIHEMIPLGQKLSRMATKATQAVKAATDWFEKNMSYVKYECRFCQFDFSESAPIEDLSVHDPEMAVGTFKVKVGNFFEQSQYKFHEIMTKDGWAKHNGEKYFEERPLKLDDILGMGLTLFQAGQSIAKEYKMINSSAFKG